MTTSSHSTSQGRAQTHDIIRRLACSYGLPQRDSVGGDPVSELVATILSQHTSDINTERAFRSLRARFPSWEEVIDAPSASVADAIRNGGLADTKAPRIQQVLRIVRERTGGFDLRFLKSMSTSEARAWLTSLPGVGPKTASCVLLFALEMNAMPVDTHVHRVALRLGLVPTGTSAIRTQDLLEALLPADSLYDAHVLMIRHGRATCVARRPACQRCVLRDICPSVLTVTDAR
jgi:endonuclease III